jgi:ligand-binding SRPBCC domain-containing protein
VKTYILRRRQWVPQALDIVFDFFSRPTNLQSITPPFLDFKIIEAPAQIQARSLIHYTLRIHKIPVRWNTEITDWNPPHSFVDLQISGPYTLWRHTHMFTPERSGTTIRDGTMIEDQVEYALPLGVLGKMAHWILVRRDLKIIFDYRGERMRELFGK